MKQYHEKIQEFIEQLAASFSYEKVDDIHSFFDDKKFGATFSHAGYYTKDQAERSLVAAMMISIGQMGEELSNKIRNEIPEDVMRKWIEDTMQKHS